MNDKIKHEQAETLSDDSLAYEQAQAASVQADDPLAAIKALRLGQLAVCRLRSEQEMQTMRDELESGSTDKDVAKE
ncbi:MAG TPA: hypothetical protein VFD09_03185 [Thiopseudomonas sp.]|nr:hypothetical protein [Thiopseudomonas sp.]